MKRAVRQTIAGRACLVLGAWLLSTGPAMAQTSAPDWSRWSFLLGEWVGEGAGQPGQGEGAFSFSLELQGRVIVRRSRTYFPAAEGRPAFAHDDLMIISKQPGLPEKAIYFDNEGHVIEYVASLAEDGNSVKFVSSWNFSAPIFRLTYAKAGPDGLAIKFEMAAADNPSQFKTYLEGRARRK
jgi:hypothetical protein